MARLRKMSKIHEHLASVKWISRDFVKVFFRSILIKSYHYRLDFLRYIDSYDKTAMKSFSLSSLQLSLQLGPDIMHYLLPTSLEAELAPELFQVHTWLDELNQISSVHGNERSLQRLHQ